MQLQGFWKLFSILPSSLPDIDIPFFTRKKDRPGRDKTKHQVSPDYYLSVSSLDSRDGSPGAVYGQREGEDDWQGIQTRWGSTILDGGSQRGRHFCESLGRYSRQGKQTRRARFTDQFQFHFQ